MEYAGRASRSRSPASPGHGVSMNGTTNEFSRQQAYASSGLDSPSFGESNSVGEAIGSTIMSPGGSIRAATGVAAAPKPESLYESMLRYHNEHDSDSDDDSKGRRRRRGLGAQAGPLKTPQYDGDQPGKADDQKLSPFHSDGKPAALLPNASLKSPPAGPALGVKSSLSSASPASELRTLAVENGRLPELGVDAPLVCPTRSSTSTFYLSALEASRDGNINSDSLKKLPRPGVVQVNEPAIRSDSAMYQAAYGEPANRQQMRELNGSAHTQNTLDFPSPMGVSEVRGALAALKESKQEAQNNQTNFQRFASNSAGSHQPQSPSPSRRPSAQLSEFGLSQSTHVSRVSQSPPSRYHPERSSGPGLSQSTHVSRSSESPSRPYPSEPSPGPGLSQSTHVSRSSQSPSSRYPSEPRFGPGFGQSTHVPRPSRRYSSEPRSGFGLGQSTHTSPSIQSTSEFRERDYRATSSTSTLGRPTQAAHTPSMSSSYHRGDPNDSSRRSFHRRASSGPGLLHNQTVSAPPMRRGSSTGYFPTGGMSQTMMAPGGDAHMRMNYHGQRDMESDISISVRTSRPSAHRIQSSPYSGLPDTISNLDPPLSSFGPAPEGESTYLQHGDFSQQFGRPYGGSPSPPTSQHMSEQHRIPSPHDYNVSGGSNTMPPVVSETRRDTERQYPRPKSKRTKEPPVQPQRLVSVDDTEGIVDEDEELKLALELSKQDTGGLPSVNTVDTRSFLQRDDTHLSPSPRDAKDFQSSFKEEALQFAQTQNNSLADVLLALKLSAEESSGGNKASSPSRRSTNLDELLALEMDEPTVQPVTDLVAAGVSAEDPDNQIRILQQIYEEQEKLELEKALKASEEQSGGLGGFTGTTDPCRTGTPGAVPGSAEDFLLSQQKAMEEWQNSAAHNHSSNAPSMRKPPRPSPSTSSRGSTSSVDSSGRRRELLKRGTRETKHAISNGNAQVVICRGCGGRLQAPLSYSLVFCPKCQTISPA